MIGVSLGGITGICFGKITAADGIGLEIARAAWNREKTDIA